MNDFIQQTRHTIRKLIRTPLFTLTTVGTLALGIGANVAIFTIVNGVLLKPLPFEDPDELVGVWHEAPGLGFDILNSAAALQFTYAEEGRVFEAVGSWDNDLVSVTGPAEPEQLSGMMVTASLLPLLRVQPALGRGFTEEDDSPGSPETVILSHSYWQRQFGADPGVLGNTLRVDGTLREIIGVLPQRFALPENDAELFMPFQWDRSEVEFGNFSNQAIARLVPGTTIEQANADVDRMVPLAVEKFGGGIGLGMLEQARFAGNLHPLKEDFVGDVGNILWVLLGTVGIVLLIACANVANLFLVRAEGRQQEVAVRTAMGAGSGQIARQFLQESVALGLLGGIVGLGLASVGVRLLVEMGPATLPRLNEITLDPSVLGFTLVISIVSGVLFGLFPVFRMRGLNLVASLKEGGRGGGAGKERHRARNALVIAQMSLALVLLAGSGLMIRSFQALRAVDPGFSNPGEVLTFRVGVPRAEIEDRGELVLAWEDMLNRLAAIPGVTSVGAASSVTMDGNDSNNPLWIEDIPVIPDQLPPIRRFKWVSPNYFETMQNPILAGRAIEWADVHDRAKVVVISASLAEEYWGDVSSAIGERVGSGDPENIVWQEVVGVVGNVHDDGVSQDDVPIAYWPLASVRGEEGFEVPRSLSFAVRTNRPSAGSLIAEARQAVWAVNPNLPLANVRTLEEILTRSLGQTSFTLVMLMIAAGVALILGVVGIYGVISYIVSQRTREIGVRMALGAGGKEVTRMVLRQGMTLAGSGVVLGLVVAVGLTRLMSSLLYGVQATDPMTFGVVALMLSAVALLASYMPALRASKTDPSEALRSE